jgi:hypothetical protein
MVLALIAVFLACFCDWAPFLSPDERGTIMVLAADRRQARTRATGPALKPKSHGCPATAWADPG